MNLPRVKLRASHPCCGAKRSNVEIERLCSFQPSGSATMVQIKGTALKEAVEQVKAHVSRDAFENILKQAGGRPLTARGAESSGGVPHPSVLRVRVLTLLLFLCALLDLAFAIQNATLVPQMPGAPGSAFLPGYPAGGAKTAGVPHPPVLRVRVLTFPERFRLKPVKPGTDRTFSITLYEL
jgi:hypothetical protein